MTGNHLVIPDASAAQCFLLHRITRGRCSLMMANSLVFDDVPRVTVLINQQQIDTLGIDATKGGFVLSAEDFP